MNINDPMAQEQIDAIRKRLDATTDGPWEQCGRGIDGGPSSLTEVVTLDVECMGYCYGGTGLGVQNEADAEFIAHAREDVPALLAEVERLHDELAKTRAVTEDKVEVACKAFYEAGADKLDDTIRPQWDNLVRVSPDIAQGYRERVSAALAALLGGGDDE